MANEFPQHHQPVITDTRREGCDLLNANIVCSLALHRVGSANTGTGVKVFIGSDPRKVDFWLVPDLRDGWQLSWPESRIFVGVDGVHVSGQRLGDRVCVDGRP